MIVAVSFLPQAASCGAQMVQTVRHTAHALASPPCPPTTDELHGKLLMRFIEVQSEVRFHCIFCVFGRLPRPLVPACPQDRSGAKEIDGDDMAGARKYRK